MLERSQEILVAREGRDTMAKRRPNHDRPLAPRRPLVVVCRGGDCGSQLKHPGADHATQLRRLRDEIRSETATVTVSKCLDACKHSNVIVVVPGEEGRAVGAEPVWVAGVLAGDATSDVIAWVNQDDLDTDTPGMIQIRRFRPTRQSRRELSDPRTLPAWRASAPAD